MTTRQLTGTTAIVTGASRGFGRGVAAALAEAGAQVVGVARDPAALAEVRERLGTAFTPVAADAADPVLAGQLIDAYQPGVLVLNAGAFPLPRPIQRHTWAVLSQNRTGGSPGPHPRRYLPPKPHRRIIPPCSRSDEESRSSCDLFRSPPTPRCSAPRSAD